MNLTKLKTVGTFKNSASVHGQYSRTEQNPPIPYVTSLLIIIVPYSPSIGKCFVFYLYPHLTIKSIV